MKRHFTTIGLMIILTGGAFLTQRRIDRLTAERDELLIARNNILSDAKAECDARIVQYEQDVTTTKKQIFKCDRALDSCVARASENFYQTAILFSHAAKVCPRLRELEFVRELAR